MQRCVSILADVVKQVDVLRQVIGRLSQEFGYRVYSDEVREKFKKPCFFIAATSKMTPKTGNWMEKELRLAITYYAQDSDKNEVAYMDVIDRVQLLFQVGIPVADRYLHIESVEDDRVGEEQDVLQIIATIPYLEQVKKTKSAAELMEEIHFRVRHRGKDAGAEEWNGQIDEKTV